MANVPSKEQLKKQIADAQRSRLSFKSVVSKSSPLPVLNAQTASTPVNPATQKNR